MVKNCPKGARERLRKHAASPTPRARSGSIKNPGRIPFADFNTEANPLHLLPREDRHTGLLRQVPLDVHHNVGQAVSQEYQK